VLRVNAIHEDVRFTRIMTKGVRAELEDLAAWIGLDAVDAAWGAPSSSVARSSRRRS